MSANKRVELKVRVDKLSLLSLSLKMILWRVGTHDNGSLIFVALQLNDPCFVINWPAGGAIFPKGISPIKVKE